jgi:hypothetical protein
MTQTMCHRNPLSLRSRLPRSGRPIPLFVGPKSPTQSNLPVGIIVRPRASESRFVLPASNLSLDIACWRNIPITLKIPHRTAVRRFFFFHSSENCLTVLPHFFSTNVYHACSISSENPSSVSGLRSTQSSIAVLPRNSWPLVRS